MKAIKNNLAVLAALGGFAVLTLSVSAFGGDAETSASAGARPGRPGTAAGSAHYEGDVGFARSDTRTGAVNEARSVALGVDNDGLALSVSTAVAPDRGPAVGINFNLSIDEDGDVAGGFGLAIGREGRPSTVSVAGGANTAGQSYSTASAVSSPLLQREVIRRESVQPVVVRRSVVRREVVVQRETLRPTVVEVRREIPTVVRREVEVVRTPARIPGQPTVIREFGRGR